MQYLVFYVEHTRVFKDELPGIRARWGWRPSRGSSRAARCAHTTGVQSWRTVICDEAVVGRGNTLALTGLPWMILFAMAGMTIFLVSRCSILWACLSDDHGFRWPPWC